MVGLLEFGVVGLLELGVIGLLERDPERRSGNRCGEIDRFSDIPANVVIITIESKKITIVN